MVKCRPLEKDCKRTLWKAEILKQEKVELLCRLEHHRETLSVARLA